ncbi:MAG: methylisocitrate lyase [Thermoplasmataceae archaeon]
MSILRDNENLGPSELRRQIKDGGCFAAGVFNGISAMIAENAGFKASYLSGSGVAASMGYPDISITTLSEVAEEVRRITRVTKMPLIVDCDTGFGETMNVVRTIRMMEEAGASAMHIEDQILPKRCGHLDGKELVSKEQMSKKIQTAANARKNKDFTIIARTDSRSVEGIDSAVIRAKSYLSAGADAIFIEALQTEDEFKEFSSKIKAPLLANMTEFGKSPLLSFQELRSMGYSIVIYPLTAFRAMMKNLNEIYSELLSKGTQRNFIDKLMTRQDFYELIEYDDYTEEDKTAYLKGE